MSKGCFSSISSFVIISDGEVTFDTSDCVPYPDSTEIPLRLYPKAGKTKRAESKSFFIS